MNNDMKRPIGIFDSGFGGLTVMRAVMQLMPQEDIVYFGDTAHVPYGSKSKKTVTRYALSIAAFLQTKNVKMIVVACNTASAFALDILRRHVSVPVIGVIVPGAAAAVAMSHQGRIGVIGTEGTVRSESYVRAIRKIDSSTQVVSQSCPLFVPLAEEGWVDGPIVREIIKTYMRPLLKKKIDAIVLGCTHYPLLKSAIARVVGKKINLIDSAQATAAVVDAELARHGLRRAGMRQGRGQFYVSDAPRKFKLIGQRFIGIPIGRVRHVRVEG